MHFSAVYTILWFSAVNTILWFSAVNTIVWLEHAGSRNAHSLCLRSACQQHHHKDVGSMLLSGF